MTTRRTTVRPTTGGTKFRDKTAIVGIGYAAFTRDCGTTVLNQASEACLNAIHDAGLTPADIDGIVMYELAGDSAPPGAVANSLGIRLKWGMNINGGGNMSSFVVQLAAEAVYHGGCRNVIAFRALNGRSGIRIGRLGGSQPNMPGQTRGPSLAAAGAQWTSPYGQAGPPSGFALTASRYFDLYGAKNLDFADIAINNRKNAEKNPRAIMRTPMTVEDHQNSRWIVYPFRLFDCCQETDAACAVVVTSAARAKKMTKHAPIYISSAVGGSAPTPDLTITNAANIREQLLGEAGITLKDVDVFEPYDCFAIMPILLLEDMGFVKKGEGYKFVKGGRMSLDGEIPMSTHGGLLSEGYVHGFNNVTELVQQMRGEAEDLCPGWREGKHTYDRKLCRQVKNAEIGLNVSVSGGSALVMRRG